MLVITGRGSFVLLSYNALAEFPNNVRVEFMLPSGLTVDGHPAAIDIMCIHGTRFAVHLASLPESFRASNSVRTLPGTCTASKGLFAITV
jgi:hypothetical protein